ncbi:hypothetical protein BDZ89DRAFT_1083654 [Hymenopellis radicata]|nr:hypothetical protein BDZ89DRAFT_1083654 [Hymenopellis radicata]
MAQVPAGATGKAQLPRCPRTTTFLLLQFPFPLLLSSPEPLLRRIDVHQFHRRAVPQPCLQLNKDARLTDRKRTLSLFPLSLLSRLLSIKLPLRRIEDCIYLIILLCVR